MPPARTHWYTCTAITTRQELPAPTRGLYVCKMLRMPLTVHKAHGDL